MKYFNSDAARCLCGGMILPADVSSHPTHFHDPGVLYACDRCDNTKIWTNSVRGPMAQWLAYLKGEPINYYQGVCNDLFCGNCFGHYLCLKNGYDFPGHRGRRGDLYGCQKCPDNRAVFWLERFYPVGVDWKHTEIAPLFLTKSNPTRDFRYGRDPEYGSFGMRPAEHPGFSYLEGMGVAHDILEHFPQDYDSVASEFKALGASLYVRGDAYYAHRGSRYTAEENVASEFGNLWRYMTAGQYLAGKLFSPPSVRGSPPYDEALLRKSALDELLDIAAMEDVPQADMVRFVDAALKWIHVGYKQAKRRYKRYTRNMLLNSFIRIEDEVNKAVKRLEFEQPVKILYDIRRSQVEIQIPLEDEDGVVQWVDYRFLVSPIPSENG